MKIKKKEAGNGTFKNKVSSYDRARTIAKNRDFCNKKRVFWRNIIFDCDLAR